MRHDQPPRLAAALLWIAPREYRDYLAGDLQQEFVNRGASRQARRWYWRQVAASLAGFAALRWRRCAWAEPATAFAVTAAWLFVGWHALWTYVLSQVPLKADAARWFW